MTGSGSSRPHARDDFADTLGFPTGSFVSAVTVTTCVLAALLWWGTRSLHVTAELGSRSRSTERVCGRVTYLDEVLTMSARMYAATGDVEWKDRYETHAAELDAELATFDRIGDAIEAAAAAQTAQANERLIALEDRAFALVAQGDRASAARLLSSPDYVESKRIYREGTRGQLARMRAGVDQAIAQQREHAFGALIAALGALGFVTVMWTRVGLVLRHNAAFRAEAKARLVDYAEGLQRANARLDDARALAERANAAKSRFLANVSHEIRTPLNGVLGCAGLLEGTDLTLDQRDYSRAIQASGRLLVSIIEDVLDLSKIEAGCMTIDAVATPIRPLIERVADMFGLQASDAGIALRFEVATDLPPSMVVDATRIQQILVNLIGNAIKFTQEGEVVVEVSYSELSQGQGQGQGQGDADGVLAITVRDTGIGIGADRLGQLFEPFRQADESTTRRFGGTGLGLTISRQLVELMGGNIDIASTVGVGTSIAVTVPVDVAAPSASGEPEPDERPREPALAARVLVVDDNAINRLVAQRMLERIGCSVETAGNGQECLEKFERSDFDAIFMDCEMPVMDGFEATRRIREGGPARGAIPIIGVTANAIAGDRERCLSAGMTDYLAKPVDPGKLRRVIEPLARRARRQPAGAGGRSAS